MTDKLQEWKGEWVGTNNGNTIRLDQCPALDQITIEDIATGLSNVCRFNGQLKTWYSVAEHCIHVAELVPEKYKLQALLHDATEAFICDVPTPLKRMLGEQYAEVERRIAETIGIKFNVNLAELSDAVKYADRIMVVSERDAFQAKPQSWGPAYDDVIRYPKLIRRYTTPETARAAFLVEFRKLTGQAVAQTAPDPRVLMEQHVMAQRAIDKQFYRQRG